MHLRHLDRVGSLEVLLSVVSVLAILFVGKRRPYGSPSSVEDVERSLGFGLFSVEPVSGSSLPKPVRVSRFGGSQPHRAEAAHDVVVGPSHRRRNRGLCDRCGHLGGDLRRRIQSVGLADRRRWPILGGVFDRGGRRTGLRRPERRSIDDTSDVPKARCRLRARFLEPGSLDRDREPRRLVSALAGVDGSRPGRSGLRGIPFRARRYVRCSGRSRVFRVGVSRTVCTAQWMDKPTGPLVVFTGVREHDAIVFFVRYRREWNSCSILLVSSIDFAYIPRTSRSHPSLHGPQSKTCRCYYVA
mmetsp:Transcript_4770/g.12253  ORF Transcript_4770/g.12253 Transcript_4770/m.12253 type:complete len:300 (-) Transcript_4770:136-1035(-)